MSKKGVSDVITTVLMILIVLAAIGIVWAVVSSFLNNSTEQIDLGAGFSQIDIVDNSVKYLPGDVLQIKVKRDSNPGNISGLRIIVESVEGNVQSYDINTLVKELETKTIDVQLQGKIQNISKVSIAPRTPIKNKIKTGSTADEQVIGSDSNLVSNDGLVGYWSFDNDQGSLIVDSSGNGNNGLCYTGGCPTLINGKFGKGYLFDGVDDAINITRGNSINSIYGSNNKYSVAGWINPNVLGNGFGPAIFSDEYEGTPRSGYRLYLNSGSGGTGTGIRIANIIPTEPINNGEYKAFSASGVSTGSWQFFVGTYDGTTLKFYKNGVLLVSSPAPSLIAPLPTNIPRIGNFKRLPVTSLNGTLDEVRVYNRTLSDQEIYYLYKYN